MARKCIGTNTITDLSAAVGLGALPAGTKYAVVQAYTQAVRYWENATAPTASTGVLLAVGASHTVSGKLSDFRAIQATAGAAHGSVLQFVSRPDPQQVYFALSGNFSV